MARRLRVEVEGGLYHLITRGNDRQDIFRSHEDRIRFLAFLLDQKERLPFYLYAYCLMTNHIHLLIERREAAVGKIMQRLLTAYSQYFNRRYGRVGHVFQGRHKAILCQSDPYLARLIRYIHLNPVRARMVSAAEDYPYSSQRAYLGIEQAGVVDIDPVLRRFGPDKKLAMASFAEFIRAGAKSEDEEIDFSSPENDILGSGEFVDANIHRMGEVEDRQRRKPDTPPLEIEPLLAAVERVFKISREVFCGTSKSSQCVMAKEIFIMAASELGATAADLSSIVGLDSSSISRRLEAARLNAPVDSQLSYAKALVDKEYLQKIAESHA